MSTNKTYKQLLKEGAETQKLIDKIHNYHMNTEKAEQILTSNLRRIYDLMTCELAALRNQKQTRVSNERLEGYEDAIHDLKIIIKDTFSINVGYTPKNILP